MRARLHHQSRWICNQFNRTFTIKSRLLLSNGVRNGYRFQQRFYSDKSVHVLCGLSVLAVGLVEPSKSSNNGFVIEITPNEMQTRRGKKPKYIIFDVREPHELENKFHLDGNDWINIPKDYFLYSPDLKSLEQTLSKEFNIDISEYDEIYFTCKGGFRGGRVAYHLLELGIDKQLFNIIGGMSKYHQDCKLNL
eukprot:263178_1